MTASLVVSDVFREVGYPANHPLAIARVGSVLALCDLLGWAPREVTLPCPEASRAQLERVHQADYVEALMAVERSGQVAPDIRLRHNIGTAENPVFPGLFRRAALSVGGAIEAAMRAAGGGVVFHPAGGTHHGMPDRAHGFCYFNDPVFAILTLLDRGMARVLYVDLDAHHGDGVEAAFAGDPRVALISVHEENRWPGTGRLQDRAGGNARNLAVPAAMNDSEMNVLMAQAILPLARGLAPDAVVITCGADALAGDPLSSLNLSNGCLWAAVADLVALAPAAVVLGGGGYNPWTVARLWTGLWGRLAGHALPDVLPRAAQDLLRGLSCDLIDDDEIRPSWTQTLTDPPNPGPVRQRFHDIVAAVLAVDSAEAA